MKRLILALRTLNIKKALKALLLGQNAIHPVHDRLLPQICSYIDKENFIFIDVGANKGIISETIMKLVGDIEIIAYEPQKNCHDDLKKIERNKPNFNFKDIALGKNPGKLKLNSYANHGLSSMKPIINDLYESHEEGIELVDSYDVDVAKLDDELKNIKKDIFLKLDVQGFEKEVLDGAKELFANKKIKILMIELMTVIKYENDNLFNVYANLLEQYGFVMIDLHQGYRNNAGIMTEFDAVFMEKNMLKDFLKS